MRVNDQEKWSASIGNSCLTTGDILNNWNSMIYTIDINDKWREYAGPGGMNDPCMIKAGNGWLIFEEEKIHFGLWCLSKLPLLIRCDVTNMSKQVFELLNNPKLITINQDKLGIQGHKIKTEQPRDNENNNYLKDGNILFLKDCTGGDDQN